MAKNIEFADSIRTPIRRLEPGDLIEFIYKRERRYAVVVAPDWKDAVDCYSFKDLRDFPIELAEFIVEYPRELEEGQLWNEFNTEYDYRSFKHNEIVSLRVIPFEVIDDDDDVENVMKRFGF